MQLDVSFQVRALHNVHTLFRIVSVIMTVEIHGHQRQIFISERVPTVTLEINNRQVIVLIKKDWMLSNHRRKDDECNSFWRLNVVQVQKKS